jgi:hypothetical protein
MPITIISESPLPCPGIHTQPDDGTLEIQLSQEISELWSVHTRLAANHKTTAKELRQLRAKLAESLYAVKNLLSRPGRGGEWRGWLRERRIPRSTADRLVSRHAETLTGENANVPSGAISNLPEDSAEKLAKSVWQRFGKTLATDECVIRFIGCIAELSGVGHEQRDEGLLIFMPAPEDADEVPASAPAAGPAPQPPQGGNAIPAEAPAADPAPQPSCETVTATEGPAAETTAVPTENGQAPAAADAGSGGVA